MNVSALSKLNEYDVKFIQVTPKKATHLLNYLLCKHQLLLINRPVAHTRNYPNLKGPSVLPILGELVHI